MRLIFTSLLFFSLAACPLSNQAAGVDSSSWETSPAIDRALFKAQSYLDKTQSVDGSWSNAGQYRMAVTSLSCLAFLSTGNSPDRGAYKSNVSRGLDFILSQTKNSTFKEINFLTTKNEARPMYGHGFATLFLAQVYGTFQDDEKNHAIRRALRKCVKCITLSQSKDGGWYYTPDSREDEGSVTVTQLQALRAAHNCGIYVSETVINRAIRYLCMSQNPTGDIRYRVGMKGRGTKALTAAGLTCFFNCGVYGGDEVDRAITFLDKAYFGGKPGPDSILKFSNFNGHWMYTQQYASQALFYLGGDRWKCYFKSVSDILVKKQQVEGSWTFNPGEAYSTPVGILVLSMPYRYLPINQR